jgi:hypothetical protein
MNKEENNKLLELYDLNSFCKIVNLLPNSTNVNDTLSFDMNNKSYKVTIKDGSFIIKCNDGRELTVNGWLETITIGDECDLDQYACGRIQIIYKMSDDSKIVLSNQMIGPKWYKYESFAIVNQDDITKNVIFGRKNPSVSFFTKIKRDGEYFLIARYPDCYSYTGEITKNGIILDRCVMSPDMDRIITFDDKVAPSEKEIRNFDGEKEERRINNLINNSDLSSKTKETLIEDIDISNVKAYYENLLFYYDNVLPLAKKTYMVGNKLKDGEAHKWLFTEEELQYVSFMIRLFTTGSKYKDIHREVKAIAKDMNQERKINK